ncbi:ribosomal subunit 39S-domain-containing protein [Biscogniauxia marginata]|nr:ribosomal subunit 39S-domain-containing protein [Biscogniauxia marginata]
MRLIPRLRRPSGLSSSSIPFSSTPQAHAAHATTSLPRPATNSPRSRRLSRFYSSNKQPIPRSLAQPSVGQDAPTTEQADDPDEATWDRPPRQHQLYKPPPSRTYASRLDEVSDPSYAPASNADGLETVGDLDDWWDRSEHWGEASDFVGFRPREKVVDPLSIEGSVRRAVAEAFALRQAGREGDLTRIWPVGGGDDLRRVTGLGLRFTEDGHVSLDGDVAEVVRGLQWETELPEGESEELSTVESEAIAVIQSTPTLSSEELLKFKKAWDHSWKRIPLVDPRIRFAVTKRLFQLTGQLVPDHKLPSITYVQALLHVVQKPPKPKTLTEEIQKHQQDLLELPNVSVATKRVTRGDKEQALGRLKLMQEELKKRDLPLEGHGFARKNREMSRFRGGV